MVIFIFKLNDAFEPQTAQQEHSISPAGVQEQIHFGVIERQEPTWNAPSNTAP